MIRKILLALTLLMLGSCASNQSLIQSNKIYTGMSKEQLRKVLLFSPLNDDAFLNNGFQAYYPDKGIEIIAGKNKQIFYVFHNVTIPLGNEFIRTYGNGTLLSYHWDYQSAMNAINPKIETVINKSEEKIVETVVKSEKFSKLENQERKKNVITNKNTKLVDSQFSKKCEGGLFSKGYKKGTVEFDDCVKKEEKLAALDMQKKQELDQAKIQEEQLKISKMKPDDRRTYTCNEKFGFRKGSDKFKDCIFELYKAEAELEKLELQKQVAKANADAARANAEAARAGAERQERLALAQTEAAKMQALAARQQAIAANTADSLALIESGLRMMSPQPAPRMRTTCTYTGGFMNCF